MRTMRVAVLVAAALVAPGLPTFAAPTAPVVTPVVRSAAVALGTTVAALTDERLLGVTWTSGTPRVRARWHSAAGWGAWRALEDDSLEPEPAERARTRPGTDPLWRPTGSDLVQVDVRGTARGLRLVRVSDGVRSAVRTLSGARAEAATTHGVLGSVGVPGRLGRR